MGYRLGIIPAAGKAERFGGILKELLPTLDGVSFLHEAVDRLIDCDNVVIVTTKEKIADHVREIGSAAHYVIQHGKADIWSAIRSAIDIPADDYLFTMPDTLMPTSAFSGWNFSAFGMGLFHTSNTTRYGMYRNGRVYNKQAGDPGTAWGLLAWSRAVADYWIDNRVDDYTEAINMAISKFSMHTWDIGWYHDNASIDDYLEYMRNG